jgi:hypothetical protein
MTVVGIFTYVFKMCTVLQCTEQKPEDTHFCKEFPIILQIIVQLQIQFRNWTSEHLVHEVCVCILNQHFAP